uniref:HVA22-like protein n=1 Tax=Rhizophora mucronata TaxID=61149 RepID=A0A2P2L1Y2_RHIMU
MIGSFLTRGLMMVFGYAYPAYECYKTVEKNKPEIEKLRFWCQYWILVAVLTVCERIGDAFISWVPMYSEAKLAFFIYLWYPKTMGTTYVYDSFFRPYVAKHENEIDRNLLELRTRAGDMAVLYWQRAASYGQTRVFDILQYVAAQSTPRQRPAQVGYFGVDLLIFLFIILLSCFQLNINFHCCILDLVSVFIWLTSSLELLLTLKCSFQLIKWSNHSILIALFYCCLLLSLINHIMQLDVINVFIYCEFYNFFGYCCIY